MDALLNVTVALLAGRQLCLFVLHDITKLKALENMRTDFVANVSHELRTPVTVIRGFTDTLLDEGEDLDPTQRRSFLLKIQRNVVRLISLLEDLLTLSRLEGRALKLELEQLQLNDLVKETVESIDERLPEGCSLALELDPELPQTAIDPLRIGQVLENLLNNAIRHAKGMKTLRVRTYIEQSRVTCAVEDDGCGIPLADLPHIFERFYRVDKGRSRESGGTGLGLSIVKHIVMQHGGNIFVSSRVGEGSRFGFTLPLRQVKDMDNESASN
jgi:signal transduction histidine kinase